MNDEIRLVSESSSGIYTSSCGCEIAIIKIANDVVMTSKEMARMFGVSIPTISKKLKKLFSTGELNKKQVSSILTHKASDGKLYRTTYYTSQVVFIIGTILKSPEAERFQGWLVLNSKMFE